MLENRCNRWQTQEGLGESTSLLCRFSSWMKSIVERWVNCGQHLLPHVQIGNYWKLERFRRLSCLFGIWLVNFWGFVSLALNRRLELFHRSLYRTLPGLLPLLFWNLQLVWVWWDLHQHLSLQVYQDLYFSFKSASSCWTATCWLWFFVFLPLDFSLSFFFLLCF